MHSLKQSKNLKKLLAYLFMFFQHKEPFQIKKNGSECPHWLLTHTPQSMTGILPILQFGILQRKRVFKFLSPLLNKQADVLEINCGTGEDALTIAPLVNLYLQPIFQVE